MRQMIASSRYEHSIVVDGLEREYDEAHARWKQTVLSNERVDDIRAVVSNYEQVDEDLASTRQKLMIYRAHGILLEKIHKWLNAVKGEECETGWKDLILLSGFAEEHVRTEWPGMMEKAPMWDWVQQV